MDFIACLFLIFCILYLLYIIILCLIDSDLGLLWAEKFGAPIGSLKGKVIWVTGASSGIGKHLAITLASHGARLALSARRVDELEKVKQRCLEARKDLQDGDVLIVPLDVTQLDTHNKCFQDVIKHFGSLDILVNNAGRSQRALWEDIDTEVDHQMFELNVFGVVSLTRIAVRYFAERGRGHVAVTSSLAGVIGVPFSGTYTATKWAIHGYFNSLRTEKLGSKLTVTLLCPGPTFTDFLAHSFTDKVGETYGKPVSSTDRRMTGQRCGEIFAVALANKLPEVWAALFPLIPMCYVMVYYPIIGKLLAKRMGSKEFLKLRDSKVSIET